MEDSKLEVKGFMPQYNFFITYRWSNKHNTLCRYVDTPSTYYQAGICGTPIKNTSRLIPAKPKKLETVKSTGSNKCTVFRLPNLEKVCVSYNKTISKFDERLKSKSIPQSPHSRRRHKTGKRNKPKKHFKTLFRFEDFDQVVSGDEEMSEPYES